MDTCFEKPSLWIRHTYTYTVFFNFILLSPLLYLLLRLLSDAFCPECLTVHGGVKWAQISGPSSFEATSEKQKCRSRILCSNRISHWLFLTERFFYSSEVTTQCMLGKMGGARIHPGIYLYLAKCGLFNWNSTWAATDDVSQVHKNTSPDKNADWESARVFAPGGKGDTGMSQKHFVILFWKVLYK